MKVLCVILIVFVIKCVVSIANKDITQDFSKVLYDLSSVAIQGRQYQHYPSQYYHQNQKYHSYYNYYNPQKYQYELPSSPNYPSNDISNSLYQYYSPTYPPYPNSPFTKPASVIQKTQESVMDALFSIAQNDDLQCVPKILCEVTAGGLTGRQGGFNSPISINLESLVGFLSGLNSANMSPVLHFGKAAVLGFASKGNTRSCQNAYPECPGDPDKLIQYLNNHNGGFFRFFQGLNPTAPNLYQQNYAQYFNGYRPGYFGKALAEKRIQNQPAHFVTNGLELPQYSTKNRDLSSSQISYTTPISYETYGAQRISFPQSGEDLRQNYVHSGAKTLKFPINEPYRHGKKLHFEPYQHNSNDNILDIQRPLPNHVPTPNIFPDRTGTGELKLDLDDLEYNYQQSLAYDFDHYNQLLYDSFPKDRNQKASMLNFPNE